MEEQQEQHQQTHQEIEAFLKSLSPINIPGDQTPEIYLGLIQDNTYDGSRIFFNAESFEFGIFTGTFHAPYHTWRISKIKGQPKGVHSLLSCASQKYLTFAEVEVQYPEEDQDPIERQVDFMTEEDCDKYEGDPRLFDVLMDPQNNVYVRVHGTEFFLCADIEQGAIDFCSLEEFTPAAFVLTIPRANITNHDLKLVNIKQDKKVLKEQQPSFQNKEDKEKSFKISPEDQTTKGKDQANKTASPSSVADTKYINSVEFNWPKTSQGKDVQYQVGIEQSYLEVNLDLDQVNGTKKEKVVKADPSHPCLFLMGPKQEWEAPLQAVDVKVPAFSSKNYRTCLSKNNISGEFRLNLTLQNESKPFSINGQIKVLDHQFQANEFQKRADCCSCSIF